MRFPVARPAELVGFFAGMLGAVWLVATIGSILALDALGVDAYVVFPLVLALGVIGFAAVAAAGHLIAHRAARSASTAIRGHAEPTVEGR